MKLFEQPEVQVAIIVGGSTILNSLLLLLQSIWQERTRRHATKENQKKLVHAITSKLSNGSDHGS